MVHSFADGALVLSYEDDVAWLTLNRPEKRNALNLAMWRALPEALDAIAGNRSVKVAVLCGAGGHFASGADISEFETTYASRAAAARYGADVAAGVEALAALERPAIAAIQGVCVGGGLALALACDIRLAASDARFAITPAKLGLVYSLADTKRLIAAVGPSAAKNILFTGRLIGGTEALSLRLIDAVHDAEALRSAVAAKAQQIAAVSQWSVRATKKIVALIMAGLDSETEETRAWFLDAIEAEDFREGRAAYLAKRSPVFPYR